MSNEIISEIRLELDKFRADLKQSESDAKDSAKKSGTEVGEGFENAMSGLAKKLVGLFAIKEIFGGMISALKEGVAAASEQETAINALNSAMALSGTYTDAASQHFQDFTASLQKTTVYADEVIQQGGALLVTMGKLSGDGLDRATKASLDMASALGIDASSAFNIVAKAATGHTAALGRYGISVKQTGDETRDFATALTALETKFKGFAALQTGTFDGALKQTKNQFGEVLEAIGNIIIKSPTVIYVMNALAKAFAQVADAITKWAAGRDIIGELAKALITFGGYVNTFLIAPVEFAFNLFKTGVLTVATLFTGLISVISLVGAAINEYLVKPVVDFLGGALGKLVSLVDKDMGASIANFVATATQATTDGLKSIGDQAAGVTTTLATATTDAANSVFDFNVAGGVSKYLAKADEFFASVTPPLVANFKAISDAVKPNGVSLWGEFADGFMSAQRKVAGTAEAMGKTMQALGASMQATIATGATNAFAAMGAAMVKGENGMAAFGKALLGVLGDIAIQFGATFIAMGVAKTLLFDPTGPLLIAAGATLAVIGGALKALSGGGGAAPAGGAASSGGGVAAGGGTGAAPVEAQATTFNDQQRGDVGTKVEVNVQGNVFDRRETGMHIADVLRETFDTNGVSIGGQPA